jgi:hypothetical protein
VAPGGYGVGRPAQPPARPTAGLRQDGAPGVPPHAASQDASADEKEVPGTLKSLRDRLIQRQQR